VAPFIPVSKVLRVRTLWTDIEGTPKGTRQFFSYSGSAPTASDLNVMASNIIANSWPNLAGQMTSEKVLTEVVIEDLTSSSAAVGTSTGSESGGSSDQYLPASCVAICNFIISERYRGGHPRAAMPFGARTDLLNPSQWSTTAQGNFLAAVEGYIGSVEEQGWGGAGVVSHVDVSYRHADAARVPPAQFPVTGYLVNQRVGAARRRLGRSSG
jgi:hypothetical protein